MIFSGLKAVILTYINASLLAQLLLLASCGSAFHPLSLAGDGAEGLSSFRSVRLLTPIMKWAKPLLTSPTQCNALLNEVGQQQRQRDTEHNHDHRRHVAPQP